MRRMLTAFHSLGSASTRSDCRGPERASQAVPHMNCWQFRGQALVKKDNLAFANTNLPQYDGRYYRSMKPSNTYVIGAARQSLTTKRVALPLYTVCWQLYIVTRDAGFSRAHSERHGAARHCWSAPHWWRPRRGRNLARRGPRCLI